MVTEAKTENRNRTPTESEIAALAEQLKKIRELNDGIDQVRDRLAFRLPVTQEERAQMMRDQVKLERLLLKAEIDFARFE